MRVFVSFGLAAFFFGWGESAAAEDIVIEGVTGWKPAWAAVQRTIGFTEARDKTDQPYKDDYWIPNYNSGKTHIHIFNGDSWDSATKVGLHHTLGGKNNKNQFWLRNKNTVKEVITRMMQEVVEFDGPMGTEGKVVQPIAVCLAAMLQKFPEYKMPGDNPEEAPPAPVNEGWGAGVNWEAKYAHAIAENDRLRRENERLQARAVRVVLRAAQAPGGSLTKGIPGLQPGERLIEPVLESVDETTNVALEYDLSPLAKHLDKDNLVGLDPMLKRIAEQTVFNNQGEAITSITLAQLYKVWEAWQAKLGPDPDQVAVAARKSPSSEGVAANQTLEEVAFVVFVGVTLGLWFWFSARDNGDQYKAVLLEGENVAGP